MSSTTPPSEGELLLLRALWQHPGATVQRVHDYVNAHGKAVGYTTVLTQLQRLHRKGLVKREKRGKQHLYRASEARAATEKSLIDRLSAAAFNGSPIQLALRALGNDRPTADELDELERWVNEQKNRT